MDIKQLLLEGCGINMPYKSDKESWDSESKIRIFSGYFGKPEIIVETTIDSSRTFDLLEIDEAIKYFEDFVFNPNNLMYKMNETLCELNENGDYPELDDDDDYDRVRAIIEEKLK